MADEVGTETTEGTEESGVEQSPTQETGVTGSEGDKVETPAGPEVPTADTSELTDALNEVRNLKTQLIKRQDENEKLKASVQERRFDTELNRTLAPATQTEPEHEALRGLPRNEDGWPIIDGAAYPPGMVIEQWDAKKDRAEFRAFMQEQRELVATAEARAAQAKSYERIGEAITDAAIATRTQHFPDISEVRQTKIDRLLLREASEILQPLIDKGGPEAVTEEVVKNALKQAFDDTLETLGILGAKQIETNAKHRAENKVKSDGQPGVAGQKPIEQLTKAELEEASIGWATQAEAERGR